jgi:hypothetical protein
VKDFEQFHLRQIRIKKGFGVCFEAFFDSMWLFETWGCLFMAHTFAVTNGGAFFSQIA